MDVLHMDRNDYYGGDSTSLNLNQLWKRFKGEGTPPAQIGASRDYNVDMIPKFMMANGTLVRVLIHTGVTKYLSFKAVDGSYVFNKGKIHKVPSTDMEALKSPLMGLFEKRRAGKFFLFVQDYKENDPSTHKGYDLNKMTTKELISKYGLDDNTIDFIGHAVALHKEDNYLTEPAIDTLYAESVGRFQGGSPYIYPLYGLGELPQGFARLSAVYGGTYMLNKPECKIEFNDEGKVCGVTSEGETAKCKKVVCDPSYIPDKFIAFVSAQAESENPAAELKPGIDLLGPVDELFIDTYDRFEPTNDPSSDNCFISTSYDATTHFESTVMDVLSIYTKITGKTVDLSVDLSAASAAEDDL
uniref:Guanosine nucleotide diphosphate dissociation inhibitor n=1 Tax=Oryza rufipogon TaxID=4529 RepID=A0A0E0Q6I1_ORYRU